MIDHFVLLLYPSMMEYYHKEEHNPWVLEGRGYQIDGSLQDRGKTENSLCPGTIYNALWFDCTIWDIYTNFKWENKKMPKTPKEEKNAKDTQRHPKKKKK